MMKAFRSAISNFYGYFLDGTLDTSPEQEMIEINIDPSIIPFN